jgi:NAD(P)-dependent dehydrogenase (short-subunit alcohol dehydrogenase family)
MSVLLSTAVVTGANSGIGLETARGLAREGMHVVMVCRNKTKAEAAKLDIEAVVPAASLSIVLCDLSLQADVRRAATQIEAENQRLDLLVNNAGLMIRSRQVTTEGVEMMLAVNHVAPFLLTTQLLSLLQASAPARIVTVASGAHKIGRLNLDDFQATRGYGPFGLPRYSETKLMNVMFTRELARRTEGTGVTVNCLHPGAVATNLGSPSDSLQPLARMILLDAARGAETTLAVATKPEYANVNGSYFVKSKPADHKLSKAAKNTEVAAALWSATEALLVTPPSPTNCGTS